MTALAGYAGGLSAAGFALAEQSASGLGNAYAGQAAAAEDATTVFTNPAGMSFLAGPQVVLGVAEIDVTAKFSNGGSTIPAAAVAAGSQPGGNGGNAGGVVPVPNFYATLPLGEQFSIGIGVSSPFGSKIEYQDSWIGRFQGIDSQLKTINYNPSIAYKVTDAFSIGAGVSYQHLQVDLTNAIVVPGSSEGRTGLSAEDGTWGWNVGAIFQLAPDMRIGASYRSKLDYVVKGTVNTTLLATGAAVPNGSFNASADVVFPDMFSMSVVQNFGDKWDMLGDITYTHWDVLRQVNIVNTANNTTTDTLVFNFQNAWRIALGLNYHFTPSWALKTGLAWDQSPVQDQYRSVRLPDNDRFWLALGATYRPSKALAFDVGYAYLWLPGTSINSTRTQYGQPAASFTSTVSGAYKNSVSILALQLSLTF